MNNRLTIQDLAGLLAEYTGKDKNSSCLLYTSDAADEL